MHYSSRISGAVAAAVLVVTPALFTVPADAAAATHAALPDGARLTALDRLTGTFSDVDPDTGALTPAGGAAGTMFADLDVDDDGRGYALTLGWSDEGGLVPSTIQAVDVALGTASAPVAIVHTDGTPATCSTIDYTSGTVLADCVVVRSGRPFSLFGTVEPTTGILTTVWEYADSSDLLSGLATDPTTGDLYVFSGPNIGRVDLSAQTVDILVTTMPGTVIQGDFDRNGVYWATVDSGASPLWGRDTALATVDVTTGAQDVRGSLDTDGDPATPSAWGLTVWGAAPEPVAPSAGPTEPTLPPTGAALNAGPAVVGILLLTGGIVLAARRRPSLH